MLVAINALSVRKEVNRYMEGVWLDSVCLWGRKGKVCFCTFKYVVLKWFKKF